jgi:hypothetical protein
MIVVNKKPNITHLPYAAGKRRGVFSFAPGQNQIDPEIWQAVKETAGKKRMQAHYAKFLKPIGEETDAPVDPSTLNAEDFIDLIGGAMEPALLDRYAQVENGRRGGPRKTVMEAIERQTAEIRAIDDAKRSGA